jgi:hypothetical protein
MTTTGDLEPHRPTYMRSSGTPDSQTCFECGTPWPCEIVRAASAPEPFCQACGQSWTTHGRVTHETTAAVFYRCRCGSYYRFGKASYEVVQSVGDHVSRKPIARTHTHTRGRRSG